VAGVGLLNFHCHIEQKKTSCDTGVGLDVFVLGDDTATRRAVVSELTDWSQAKADADRKANSSLGPYRGVTLHKLHKI
jgi:hypothetical protein